MCKSLETEDEQTTKKNLNQTGSPAVPLAADNPPKLKQQAPSTRSTLHSRRSFLSPAPHRAQLQQQQRRNFLFQHQTTPRTRTRGCKTEQDSNFRETSRGDPPILSPAAVMFLKMHLPATQMDFNVTTAAQSSPVSSTPGSSVGGVIFLVPAALAPVLLMYFALPLICFPGTGIVAGSYAPICARSLLHAAPQFNENTYSRRWCCTCSFPTRRLFPTASSSILPFSRGNQTSAEQTRRPPICSSCSTDHEFNPNKKNEHHKRKGRVTGRPPSAPLQPPHRLRYSNCTVGENFSLY